MYKSETIYCKWKFVICWVFSLYIYLPNYFTNVAKLFSLNTFFKSKKHAFWFPIHPNLIAKTLFFFPDILSLLLGYTDLPCAF